MANLAIAVSLLATQLLPGVEAAGEFDALPLFSEPGAGYSFRIPAGFSRLTQDENREVHERLGEYFGKDVSERALRQPPVYFKGPVDPARPMAMPPSLVVSFSGGAMSIDPALKAKYREQLEQGYSKRGIRHGEITLDVAQVDGVYSLRAEHEMFNPVDNSRSRILMLMVPGMERRYDIVFNYSSEQEAAMQVAVTTVLKTFKVLGREGLDAQSSGKWGRVAAWTIGGFAAGIVLSLLLKVLSGVGAKPAQKPGT